MSLCKNGKGLKSLSEIDYYLLRHGIHSTYTIWRFHGEKLVGKGQKDNSTSDNVGIAVDNVGNLTEDIGVAAENDDHSYCVGENDGLHSRVPNHAGTSISKKKRYLYERAREPLYPSCDKGKIPLYAAIKLNNIKTQYGFSYNGVTALLELFKELLPDGKTLPSKFYEVKKLIQEMGMDFITYDTCINDCILYWKDHASLVRCPVCQEPRYEKSFNDERKLTQVARKTLRHFPLIKRLQRFYSIPWIAEAMYWHSKAQSDINVMRHPVDYLSWRCANIFH
ncbi:uncharacterized protein LOC113329875 [Papaver somniferum]|uniref:uncharacterized protein LOC113329875 n=1 Tax=Papaver somniferum TaxID=3469 RepID=UPI000E704F36|nr:uncharacterized protein LOC113329875 [Papaver somniferum]